MTSSEEWEQGRAAFKQAMATLDRVISKTQQLNTRLQEIEVDIDKNQENRAKYYKSLRGYLEECSLQERLKYYLGRKKKTIENIEDLKALRDLDLQL